MIYQLRPPSPTPRSVHASVRASERLVSIYGGLSISTDRRDSETLIRLRDDVSADREVKLSAR